MMGLYILIVLLTFLGMEFVAWFTHRYLMHGLMWSVHKDHHQKNEAEFIEKNDLFFLIFATPAIVLFLAGAVWASPVLTSIAAGITFYGLCYFLVHDICIHQRFKIFRNSDNVYLRAIRRAHKMHHKHLGKEDGECFGMLIVPFKYFKEAYRSVKKQSLHKA
jgi:beta-carotene 3-hydroxylase